MTRVYSAVSCSAISAMSVSGESALILAIGSPALFAHQTVWLGQQRTVQMSQRPSYFGRRIASCCLAQSAGDAMRSLQLLSANVGNVCKGRQC